jgi:LysM repeat protein
MKKLAILSSLLLTCTIVFGQSSAVIRDYIARFREIAIEEMNRTGVPAAITLAQGIHETGAGQSVLVKKSNNHFGIKCKSEWTGASVSHDDDARGECFRKYDDPMDSYRDHSNFLRNRAHYAFLFKLDPTDYEAWAHGLKKAGYATNPRYPQILIKLIQDYALQEYTLLALERRKGGSDVVLTSLQDGSAQEAKAPAVNVALRSQYPAGVFQINETKVMLILQGTSYLKVAEEHDLSLNRLFDFNEMTPADIAPADHLLYLQRKRRKGSRAVHVVEEGETLHAIAQKEGIRLESLLIYNDLRPGLQPKAGEKLYLQEEAPSQPALVTEVAPAVRVVPAPEEKEATETYQLHTVQPKETLYAIARKYGVTVEEVRKWNSLQQTDLKIGQQLRIIKK